MRIDSTTLEVMKMQLERIKRELLYAKKFGDTILHGGVTNFGTQLTCRKAKTRGFAARRRRAAKKKWAFWVKKNIHKIRQLTVGVSVLGVHGLGFEADNAAV